jgi:uncharacterized protein (DUF1778 family)
MPDKKALYDMEYAKKHLKRVPLDFQRERYEEVAAAAEAAGETVSGFIKKAVAERIERMGGRP